MSCKSILMSYVLQCDFSVVYNALGIHVNQKWFSVAYIALVAYNALVAYCTVIFKRDYITHVLQSNFKLLLSLVNDVSIHVSVC